MSWFDTLSGMPLSDNENSDLLRLLKASVANIPTASLGDINSEDRQLFEQLSNVITSRSIDDQDFNYADYFWHGTFPDLEPRIQQRLLLEANDCRTSAKVGSRHLLVENAVFAKKVLESESLQTFVKQKISKPVSIQPTSCFYHYYENSEQRVEPHVDTADFGLSCLMLLKHDYQAAPQSKFYVNLPNNGVVEVPLQVGEAIVFYSGGLVHTRTAPADTETVITCSWGFKPIAK